MCLCKVARGFIHIYRWTVGPLLGNCCRFYPSCSEYALEAFDRLGFLSALLVVTWRIISCHPWHVGGIDEPPESLQSWWDAKRLSWRKIRRF